MAKLRAKPCDCGSVDLKLNSVRVAEDAMSSWVSCMSCGAMGDYTDDAYSDPEGAVNLWNTYPRTQHPAEALAARSDASPEALPSTKGLAAASLPTIADPVKDDGR